uniref:Isopenicillin N synthase-like Fe(2+) 2OG dioxygenase domain-containing protein n=1 Tax=Globisporangium ultimum (strain ATCC 200006 / CBS 805.95 / DAOM BR144) TaxID=431595 RepID=K3WVE2_GLOUD
MVLSKFASYSALAVAAAAVGVCAALDDYVVPAVDFSKLKSGADAALLQAMQQDGIVALQNVPQYAALREKYLAKAAACAVTARDNKAEFLLYRKLTDGTKRYTISTESGRKLSESGKETLEHCPGYLEVYQEFSKLVEDTVADVGKALDATQALHIATGSELTLTARELMEESVHLDHFHAYQAPEFTRKLSSSYRESTTDLSLEMHTDNGLMIAMTAPEYFDVADSGEVRSKNTRSEDAGLVIQTAEGKTVRPVLQADELVLMLGSGVDQWIKTTPKLRPVLHGMRFPRGLSYADGSNAEGHKVLRAWFGKMILMNTEHVMQNTGMSYGEYADHTTRYLMESNADLGFAAVACPPDRRLQASDSKCMTKICTLKAGADSSAMLNSCQVACNHDSTDDAKLCKANCECETQTVAGHNCWMLCVADLSTDVCPGEQKCNDGFTMATLAMKCSAGTVAPTTTTTPTSSPPTTPTPSSPSPKPSTTAPATTTSSPSASTSSGSEDGSAKVSSATDDAETVNATASSGSSSSSEDTSFEGLTTDSSASAANSTRTPTPSPTTSSAA